MVTETVQILFEWAAWIGNKTILQLRLDFLRDIILF